MIGPVKRTVALVVVVAGALAWGWMHLPNALFYADSRPTRLGRKVNDVSGKRRGWASATWSRCSVRDPRG